ncbi:hypothetical protein M3Y99_01883400 [Aphelenchoides fujianensis]|nr:hypothetical protein M3Y99_01883400 [Aphelenchoides fujianensis]
MGSSPSSFCPSLAANHLSLTIQTPNTIALMDCDGPTGLVYQMMLKEYTAGVEGIQDIQYLNAFRVNDKPFASSLLGTSKSQVLATARARISICNLICKMDEAGTRLLASVYLGKMFSRSTMFFERGLMSGIPQEFDVCPPAERFICIAIRNRNILQFPLVPGLTNVKFDWIRTAFGSQLTGDESTAEYLEFSFKGQPFGNSGKHEEMITAKRLFLAMIRQFAKGGYELSVGLSLRGGFKNDTTFFKSNSRLADSNPPTNYFLLGVEERNRLRLFECPTDVAKEIQESIVSGNIREIKPSYMGCAEIVFTGTPFDAESEALANTQLMFLEICSRLWAIGWKYKGVVYPSLGRYSKVFLFFRWTPSEKLYTKRGCRHRSQTARRIFRSRGVREKSRPPALPSPEASRPMGGRGGEWARGERSFRSLSPPVGPHRANLLFESTKEAPRPAFALAMVRSDTIKLLNAPTNVRTVVRELILAVWPKGLQSESEFPRGLSLKLRGRPFAVRDVAADCVEGIHLLVCLIEKLRLCGWVLHSGLELGARMVNDEETHGYSADGSMMLFIRSDHSINPMGSRFNT